MTRHRLQRRHHLLAPVTGRLQRNMRGLLGIGRHKLPAVVRLLNQLGGWRYLALKRVLPVMLDDFDGISPAICDSTGRGAIDDLPLDNML